MESRSQKIMVNLEPTLYVALLRMLEHDNNGNQSASGYMRSLLIKDLIRKEIINEKVIAHMVT